MAELDTVEETEPEGVVSAVNRRAEAIKRSADGEYYIGFVDGHTYQGAICLGMMDGSGKYSWCDGVAYEGSFSQCNVTGTGKYTWPDGSYYVGEVLNALRHGMGNFYCAKDETRYSGQWFQGKRHGKGRIVYNSSETSYYDGNWIDNMKQGHGIEQYASGDLYEGEWYQNKRHGKGTMHWKSANELYSGHWEFGFQHGHGKHIWMVDASDDTQYPMRNFYNGEWKFGSREGSGSFQYASTSDYKKQLQDLKITLSDDDRGGSEPFTLELHDPAQTLIGTIVEVPWRINHKTGHGRCVLEDCGAFQGYFKDDNVQSGQKISASSEKKWTCVEVTLEELKCIAAEFLDDVQSVKSVFVRYISQIKRIYNFYSSLGVSPKPGEKSILRRLQFSAFLRDINISQYGLSIFDAENVLPGCNSSDPEQMIAVKDFVQALLLICIRIHKDKDQFATHLGDFLSDIIQNAGDIGGILFSDTSTQVLENLKYQKKIWQVYQVMQENALQKGVVKYRDVLWLCKENQMIDKIFSSSEIMDIMSHDMLDFNTENKLSFLEFYEMMLRCGDSVGKNGCTERTSIIHTLLQNYDFH